MQTLKLANDLFQPLLEGDKKVTVRAGKRDVELGYLVFESADPIAIGDNQTAFQKAGVTVTQVVHKKLAELTDADAQADGAADAEELKVAIRRFYPTIKDEDDITVIAFEYLPVSPYATCTLGSKCGCKSKIKE